jgi:hypothetical protein
VEVLYKTLLLHTHRRSSHMYAKLPSVVTDQPVRRPIKSNVTWHRPTKFIRTRLTLEADNQVDQDNKLLLQQPIPVYITPHRLQIHTSVQSRSIKTNSTPSYTTSKTHTHTRHTEHVLHCPGPSDALRSTGLLYSMRQMRGGTPPPRSWRAGAHTVCVDGSAKREPHLFAVPCVADAAEMYISACLPASLFPTGTGNSENRMFSTSTGRQQAPLSIAPVAACLD